jgi:hypothetical protein
MAFTVGTEACTATLNWSGVENVFPAGFSALDPSQVTCTYTSGNPAVTVPLTPGIQIAVACDPNTGAVTVTPLAMPAPPGTITIDRHTPATQQTNFANLASYTADIHTSLADQAEMGIAELRRDLARNVLAAQGLLVPVQRKLTGGSPYALQGIDRELLVAVVPFVINIGSGATQFAAQLGVAGPFDPLVIKDVSGVAGPVNFITINFTADLCDGLAALTTQNPYGGWKLRPRQDGGWFIA